MLEIHLNAQGRECTAGFNASNHAPKALPAWKRALDLTCLVFAAPALVPLMALIALAIRVSSSGPILFRQERIGLRGRPFMCFKFRTMTPSAETRSHESHLAKLIESDVPMKKLDSRDKRVSRIGLLLRASGLDELPQIFNIIRGEMSFVGPRPCIRYEYEKYRPEHRARFNAIPGLTGLWQVSGKNNTTFQEMVNLDVRYFQNLSLWQDISILFRTFHVIVDQMTELFQSETPAQPSDLQQPVRLRSVIPQPTRSPRRPERHPLTSV